MTKVFVSGCYDILHAGHIQFFEDARALGDHLTVCFASDEVLKLAKGRISSMPEDNKMVILKSLNCVDQVVKSSNLHPVFDFEDHVKKLKPDILAVTEDDKRIEEKKGFCAKHGMRLVVLSKRNPVTQTSTTKIRALLKDVIEVPLRVDFAGGWLDVPRFSRKGAYVVNCTITPKVSLENWPYEKGSGLGGSGAYALLQIKNGLRSELDMGVGWQDPAVIEETGLCVWRSGKRPVLDFKVNPDWLDGRMLIMWMGKEHVANDYTGVRRDYAAIAAAGKKAAAAVRKKDLKGLCAAINMSYAVQVKEGMDKLPDIPKAKARKYLGAGYGGYALYMFETRKQRDAAAKRKGAKKIEPYQSEQNML